MASSWPPRSKFLRHRNGVYLMFATEFWERFSYYGLLGILVFFLSTPEAGGGMGLDRAAAVVVFGNLTGLIWLAPTIGGWLADRYIGARVAVAVGCAALSIANLLLAAAAARLVPTGVVWAGLAVMIIGAGLFKSNASSLLGQLFVVDDTRRQSAFALFYMGINLGAAVAPLVAGTAGERVGWWLGFLIAGIGMAIGLIVFLIAAPRAFPPAALGDPAHAVPGGGATGTRLVLAMLPFAAVFAAGLMQYGGLMNLYAQTAVERHIGKFEVPATWFLTLNPLAILLLSAPVAAYWTRQQNRLGNGAFARQISAGLLLMAIAYAGMALVDVVRGTSLAPAWTLVLFYVVLTTGELCIIPVGLAEISRIAPARSRGLLMGLWLLTLGMGGVVAGRIGGLAEHAGTVTAFATSAGIATAGLLVLVLLRGPLDRLAARAVPG